MVTTKSDILVSDGVKSDSMDGLPTKSDRSDGVKSDAMDDLTTKSDISDGVKSDVQSDSAARFHFTFIPKRKLTALEEKSVQPYLKKWGLGGRIQSQCFAYTGSVDEIQIKDLLQEFFTSPDVFPYLKADPGFPIGQPLSNIILHNVPCTLTNLHIFQRLLEPKNGIVLGKTAVDQANGVDFGGLQLRQCLQRDIGGFLVADELRKLLLDPEDSNLFTATEKDQFQFHLFRSLCLGGMWCQYEDCLGPYLTLAKTFYKNLISVVETGTSHQLVVRSRVYKVVASADESSDASFPRYPDRDNNFAYLIVDMDRKYVTTLVHQAGWSDETKQR